VDHGTGRDNHLGSEEEEEPFPMFVPKVRGDAAACESASFRQFEKTAAQLALLDAAGAVIFLNDAFKAWLLAAVGQDKAGGNLLHAIASLLDRSTSLDAATRWPAFLAGEVDDVAATIEIERDGLAQWFRVRGTRFVCGQDVRLLFVSEDVTHAYEAELVARDLRSRLLMSRENERQLISEELHDSTVQHLVAVDLNLMRLKSRLREDAASQEILTDIEGSVAQAMRELRVSTYLLHPPILDNDRLALALRRYCDGFARRTGLSVRLDCDGTVDRLIAAAQKSILRIVQEALTNVHRHAEATQVVVRCRAHSDELQIVVSDNGVARSRGKRAQVRAGVGLASMRMRLAQFGGDMTIASEGHGTVLRCVLPLHSICKASQGARVYPVRASQQLNLVAESYPH
jgi:two-component system, NarL family, sensor kinase